MPASNRRWAMVGLVVLGLLAMVPVTSVLTRDRASAAAARPGDGTTSATAGASCWGIKQQHPASASGVYWLLNASQARPIESTCDMTTSGGGWVLVGRGRTGWTFAPTGQGLASALRTAPDAAAAVALDAKTVTELTGNVDLTSLSDGIRFERTIGSATQDYRIFPSYKAWTWSFPAGQVLTKVQIDGTTYNGSNTKDTSTGTFGQTTNSLDGIKDNRRLTTAISGGFGYGSSNTLAFTRVWLRPRIANGSGPSTPIPPGGFPAQPSPSVLKDRSELATWGVVGLNHTNEAAVNPWSNTVNVVKSYGTRTFVGGRFTHVQQGPTGATTAQPSLAAFDLAGNWIPTFRPTFAGRVWDMTMTGDGKLIVGGDFTSVNGLPGTAGLVALDPATGAVIPTWRANISRPGSTPIVRALDSRGPWIYAAGRFTKVKGGTWNEITVSSAISLKASDGTPGTWKPIINASAVRVRVSEDGSRVYLAGYFNAVNSDTNHGYHAITATATGAPIPGLGAFKPSGGSTAFFQQAVAEYNGNPIVGGSEHDLQLYDRNRTKLVDSHITRQGGDFQTIEITDGWIYAGCHCSDWLYQGTNSWSNPAGFRSIDPIRLVGRWNAETFRYDTSWYPSALRGKPGEGIWSTAMDANHCLWVGGDLNRGSYSGDAARDWLGGFARFCPEDSTPPSTPSSFTAKTEGASVKLAWGASSDASGSVSYDVYRNDRVIATVKGTTFTDTIDNGAVGSLAYTVRAADPRGNRSASPAPVQAKGPATTIATPVPFGATWKYRDDGTDQGTAWRAPGFGDGAWASGKAVLGWGGTQTTTIGATKPTTTYFRTSFPVADASQAKQLTLQAKVTQGAVVYLNGVEVGRWNMPAGPITSTTPAAAYVGGTEDTVAKVFNVPGSLLQTGANSLAVEVHGWRAGSGKVFLDLEATIQGASADTRAPTAPVLTAGSSRSGAVDLSWTPSTDDVALGGYLVRRDGSPLAVVGPLASTLVDSPVDTAVPHTYVVTAFDDAGNARDSGPVTVTPPDPAADPNLLAFGSSWRWSYPTAAPTGPWTADGYDDSQWASGAGELGFGDTPKGTVISTGPTPRPLTSYYRRTVTVADPTRFRAIAVDLIRNSGAVVYVNGVEVGRSNMPAGPVTADTYASAWVPAADRKVPVRIQVPTSAFRPGANTIAVELHLNGRTQPTAGFDLKLTGLA